MSDVDPIVIRTRELGVAYGRREVLRGVSLEVSRLRVTAIIGPSGCGKTSFLQTLNRISDLIPGSRVTGSAIVEGVDVLTRTTDVRTLRRRVGMIFQKPNPFPLSIRKNIQLALREHRLGSRDEIEATMERVLVDVGLWSEVRDRLDTSAMTLSGGQQQRLCIARALALSPEVMLLDEPCSALDPIASGRVEELILSLRQRMTIVIVTHNLAQAKRIADDVAMFWFADGAGQLVESGPVAQIFEAPQSMITRGYTHGWQG